MTQNASEDLAPAEDRGVGTLPQLDVEAVLLAGADKGDIAGLGLPLFALIPT